MLVLSQVALQKQIFSKKKEKKRKEKKKRKVSLQNAVNEIEKRRRNILRSFVAKCLKRVIHFGPSPTHTFFDKTAKSLLKRKTEHYTA